MFPAEAPAQTNGPRITALGRTNGLFSLTWTNTGTNAVTVERRGSLTSGSWGAIASNNVSGAHTDSNPPAGAAFYRLRVVSPPSPPPNPFVMALIPAGSFEMGDQVGVVVGGDKSSDELPVHTVNVSAFYMDKYEVTKALWDEVARWAATNGYDIKAASASGQATNHPVHSLTWYSMVKWSNARSQKEGLTPCYTVGGATYKAGDTDSVVCDFSANGYRLPTEAEWERAARGGSSGMRFPWGSTISHSQANYLSDAAFNYDVSPTRGYHPIHGAVGYTSPVGAFAANGYGLYDMAGNLAEWCWDWYGSSYYASSPSADPRGPASGSRRVRRSSSWADYANTTRTAERGSNSPGSGTPLLGFRCARTSVP